MIEFVLAAALAGQEAPTPPEVGAAFEAWTDCITERIEGADRAQRPRAVADSALSGCQPLQERLIAAHRSWVESSQLSDREKQAALRAMAASVERLRGDMARMVAAMRED